MELRHLVVVRRFVGRIRPFIFVIVLAILLTSGRTSLGSAFSSGGSEHEPNSDEIAYEGQSVASVEIAGRLDLDQEQLGKLIKQKPGEPYSSEKVRASIEALQREAHVSGVQLETRPLASGLQLLFVVQPALYLGILEFPGATQTFSYTQLLQVADYPDQEPYIPSMVERTQKALNSYFQRTGFFLAKVGTEVKPDYQKGIVNISFPTELGHRAEFGDLVISGTTPEEGNSLRKSLTSLRARLRNSYIKAGKPYSMHKLQNAVRFLEDALGKREYLAAQVKLIAADYNPNTNRAQVRIEITEGPKVAVKIEGAHLWSRTKKSLIPMYQENSVDNDLIQEGVVNLSSYFQSKGFCDIKVNSSVDQHPDGTTVTYRLEKGKKYRVHDIAIDGNKRFSEKELLSHVTVEKARLPVLRGSFSQKLLRTSAKNLEAVYQDAGYSKAKVTPSVRKEGKNLDVAFQVDEGQLDVVASLQIVGNDSVSESQFAPRGLNLGPGKPYSPKLSNDDRSAIVAAYLNLGYLVVNFRSTAKPLPNDPHRFQVVYSIQEGPQVHTASLIMLGASHTKGDLINHSADIKVSKPLSESLLLAADSRLYLLGIFDWSSVDPKRSIDNQSQEDVLIKLHESTRNVLSYGLGFEVINRGGSVPRGTVAVPGLPPVGLPSSFKTSEHTYYGPRGTFEYTRRNLRGRAETMTFGVIAGRLDQRGTFTVTDPSFFRTNYSSALTSAVEYSSQNPIFSATLASAGFQLQKNLDTKKTKTVIFRYNFQHTTLNNLLIPDLVSPQDRQVRLSTWSVSFIRDTRDKILDAHHGIYESFEYGITPSALGSSTNFTRLMAQTAYYKSLTSDLVWANSIRLGLEQSFSGSHIPLSERFFSGGGGTLRGFALNGAGPQTNIPAFGNPSDPATCAQIKVALGGPQLIILNSELRFPLVIMKSLGGVVFYDGGNVFNRIGFHDFLGQYSNSVGLGVRYTTPVGPIRFDVGHLVNAPPGIKSNQVFVTLGQAF